MEKATGVYVPGGRLVPSASTPEDCKLYCMMDAACEAVDFHNSLSKCISHDANDMQDYERLPNPLHDHYHKTHCKFGSSSPVVLVYHWILLNYYCFTCTVEIPNRSLMPVVSYVCISAFFSSNYVLSASRRQIIDCTQIKTQSP